MTMSLVAGAGGEALFVLLLPVIVLVLGYFGAYAVHSLLVVIEQTAVGFDRVCWPHEGFIDWFAKLLRVGAAFVLVLMPAIGAATSLSLAYPPLAVLIAAEVLFLTVWLVWPVCLLSSLSGPSWVMLLRWPVLKGLARCWAPLLVFYALTGVLLVITLGGAYFVVIGWLDVKVSMPTPGLEWVVEVGSLAVGLPVVAALAATGWLLYGRLLGRLGWMLQLGGLPGAKGQEESEPELEAEEEAVDSPAPPAPSEPLPLEVPAPAAVPGETYALADDPVPEPAPEPPPFRWGSGQVPPPAPPRSQWRDRPDFKPAPTDLREERPEPFTAPRASALLEPKVLLFPWYRTSLWAWFCLIGGALCLLALFRFPLSLL
jgi:hypothetical protein